MPLYTILGNLVNVLVQSANKMGLQREEELCKLKQNPMTSSGIEPGSVFLQLEESLLN
jgi:hypothetical protein